MRNKVILMKTIELFCGTKSFSKVAKQLGHYTHTIDKYNQFNPDSLLDIMTATLIFSAVDVLWASPPCTAFSVASIGRHWTGGNKAYIPKSKTAKEGLLLLDKTIQAIQGIKPRYWFIENPRGVMRKVIDKIFEKYCVTDYRRVTVSYCQYGDKRMKPTDIWTNCYEWTPRPMCHNGDKCHEAAPRGSKTSTQGLKGSTERGVIPPNLFREIFKSISNKVMMFTV